MSAVIAAPQTTASWRLAKALAWDAVPLRARVITGLLYGFFLLVMVLISAYLPEEKGTEGMPLLLALPTAMGWMLAWPSSLLAAMELRDWRAPQTRATYWSALALQLCATLLLPVVLSVMAGAPPASSFAIIGTGAAMGWLFALAPSSLAWLVWLAPMAGYKGLMRAFPLLASTGSFQMIGALALLLVAVWRTWRLLDATATQASGKLGRPAFMTMQNWNMDGDVRSGTLTERMQQNQGWAKSVGHLPDLGPNQPIKAMRAWLGGLFSPRSARAWATQALLVVTMIALFVAYDRFVSGKSSPGGSAGIFFTMGIMLPLAFVMRLRLLVMRSGGDWNELALLPGWGVQAHAWLLKALVQAHIAVLMGLLVMLVALMLAMKGEVTPPQCVLAALASCGLTLLGLGFSLRTVIGKPPGIVGMVLGVLVLFPMLMYALLPLLTQQMAREFGSLYFMTAAGAWGALIVVSGAMAWSAWQRLCMQPHPFLQH